MASGGGNFKGAFDVFLPFYLGKVEREVVLCCVEYLSGIDDGGRNGLDTRKMFDYLSEVLCAVNL